MPDNKMNLIETKLDYWIVESVKDQDFEEAFQIENELSRCLFILFSLIIKVINLILLVVLSVRF
jgi:hypothetical protein